MAVWMEWGFILMILNIAASLATCIMGGKKHTQGQKGAGSFQGGLGCGALAWIIAGSVFIWNDSDKVCSGRGFLFDTEDGSTVPLVSYNGYSVYPPFMAATGRFMNIYLIIIYSFFACC